MVEQSAVHQSRLVGRAVWPHASFARPRLCVCECDRATPTGCAIRGAPETLKSTTPFVFSLVISLRLKCVCLSVCECVAAQTDRAAFLRSSITDSHDARGGPENLRATTVQQTRKCVCSVSIQNINNVRSVIWGRDRWNRRKLCTWNWVSVRFVCYRWFVKTSRKIFSLSSRQESVCERENSFKERRTHNALCKHEYDLCKSDECVEKRRLCALRTCVDGKIRGRWRWNGRVAMSGGWGQA